jgi:hypothetical protein
MNFTRKAVLLSAVPALVLAVLGEPVHAMEPGVYPAPDLSKFLRVSEEDGDGDGDGVNETHILHYRNVAGDSAFSMTTKDRLWAWSMESHGGPGQADPQRNYVIRDSNCDGTFDERYSLDEQFHVPDCLK